jgi:hypothetical protein
VLIFCLQVCVYGDLTFHIWIFDAACPLAWSVASVNLSEGGLARLIRMEAGSRKVVLLYYSTLVLNLRSVAKFIVPELGDIVYSGKWLSYLPASPCSLAGRYDNFMSESTLSPQSGTMNLATIVQIFCWGT